jgi:hypothetical protein
MHSCKKSLTIGLVRSNFGNDTTINEKLHIEMRGNYELSLGDTIDITCIILDQKNNKTS